METRAAHAAVGGFVLVLIAGIVGFILWINEANFEEQLAFYQVRFSGSVTGLSEGSQVRYKGVPVGSVATIEIDPDNASVVLVRIQVSPSTPVKTDSVAILEFIGITGIAYVQIVEGSQTAELLEPAAPGELPEIPSRVSAVEALYEGFEGTPELLATLNSLGRSLDQLLSVENRDAVGQILTQLEGISRDLNRTAEDLPRTLVAAQRLLDNVDGLVTDARVELNRLGPGLEDALDDSRVALVSTTQEFEQAAAGVTRVMREVEAVIGGAREPLLAFNEQGLYELTNLLGELRELAGTLNRLTTRLERSPRDIFFGGSEQGVETR